YEEGRRDGTREAFAVVDADDGSFLGLGLAFGIDREGRQLELGYVVAPEARGRGIATRTLELLTQWGFSELDALRIELWISVDHNILQIDFKNPDDHRFLQAMAAKYGAWFSRPGNGICHYVHCERFAKPGQTLIGADSHTTQSGSCAMIAIGAGGLDVAVCMAGHPFELPCPKIVGVFLENELVRPWIQAKDVILELLRRRGVRGGR